MAVSVCQKYGLMSAICPRSISGTAVPNMYASNL